MIKLYKEVREILFRDDKWTYQQEHNSHEIPIIPNVTNILLNRLSKLVFDFQIYLCLLLLLLYSFIFHVYILQQLTWCCGLLIFLNVLPLGKCYDSWIFLQFLRSTGIVVERNHTMLFLPIQLCFHLIDLHNFIPKPFKQQLTKSEKLPSKFFNKSISFSRSKVIVLL